MKSKSKQKVTQELSEIVLPPLNWTANLSKFLRDILKNYIKYKGLNQAGDAYEDKTTDFESHIFPILYLPWIIDLADAAVMVWRVKNKNVAIAGMAEGKKQLIEYVSKIKQPVRYAFGMQKMEQHLEDIINHIDQPGAIYKYSIPRYKKLQRLRTFNNLIVDFFLQLLHNYYWVDLAAGVTSLENINTIIKRITPIVHNLHQTLLNELHYEFPKDLNEEKIYY